MNPSDPRLPHCITVGRALFLLWFLFVSACGTRDTAVSIEPGNPPTFVLSGHSTLEFLQVSGPDLEREAERQGDSRDALPFSKVYWQVRPIEKRSNQAIDKLPSIKYGKVPDGFIQVYPENGTSPPPLIDGGLYNVRLSPNNAGGVNMFFTIRGGKIYAEGK